MLHVYRDHLSQVWGGIERHVSDVTRRLVGQVDVEVVAGARGRQGRTFSDGGVAVSLAPELGRLGGVPISVGFHRAMRRGTADVIHLHSPNPAAELFAGSVPAPVVLTYHCDPARFRLALPAYARLLQPVLRRCARVVATSDRQVERSSVLRRLRDHRPDLIEVVPLGVDIRRFTDDATSAADALRATWGDRPAVLFVGRLRAYKGLPVLVEAFRHIDATLVVVGGGPERRRVEALGRTCLGERLRLVGEVGDEELPDYYRAADVACFPSMSDAEAFGLAALEAMACGRPVITTEVGTATSVVNRHGHTGLVIPPGDTAALEGALDKLLGDRALALRLGRAARERAVAHYDVEFCVRRLLAMYRDVLSRDG